MSAPLESGPKGDETNVDDDEVAVDENPDEIDSNNPVLKQEGEQVEENVTVPENITSDENGDGPPKETPAEDTVPEEKAHENAVLDEAKTVKDSVINDLPSPEAPIRDSNEEEAVDIVEAGEAVVEAAGDAIVEAAGEAAVETAGEAIVEAAGEAAVEAAGEAIMEAAGEAAVEAAGEAIVEAAGEAAVEAAGDAIVEAAGEAIVETAGEAIVEAAGNTIVEATGDAIVKAVEDTLAEEAGEAAFVEEVAEELVDESVNALGAALLGDDEDPADGMEEEQKEEEGSTPDNMLAMAMDFVEHATDEAIEDVEEEIKDAAMNVLQSAVSGALLDTGVSTGSTEDASADNMDTSKLSKKEQMRLKLARRKEERTKKSKENELLVEESGSPGPTTIDDKSPANLSDVPVEGDDVSEKKASETQPQSLGDLFKYYHSGLTLLYKRYSSSLQGKTNTFEAISQNADTLNFLEFYRMCRDFGIAHKKGLSRVVAKEVFLSISKKSEDYKAVNFELFRELLVECANRLLQREQYAARYPTVERRAGALFHRMDLAEDRRAYLTKRMIAFGGFLGGDGKLGSHVDVGYGTAKSRRFSTFDYEKKRMSISLHTGKPTHLVDTFNRVGGPDTPPINTRSLGRSRANRKSPARVSQEVGKRKPREKPRVVQKVEENNDTDDTNPNLEKRSLDVANQFHLDLNSEKELVDVLGLEFQAHSTPFNEHKSNEAMWSDIESLDILQESEYQQSDTHHRRERRFHESTPSPAARKRCSEPEEVLRPVLTLDPVPRRRGVDPFAPRGHKPRVGAIQQGKANSQRPKRHREAGFGAAHTTKTRPNREVRTKNKPQTLRRGQRDINRGRAPERQAARDVIKKSKSPPRIRPQAPERQAGPSRPQRAHNNSSQNHGSGQQVSNVSPRTKFIKPPRRQQNPSYHPQQQEYSPQLEYYQAPPAQQPLYQHPPRESYYRYAPHIAYNQPQEQYYSHVPPAPYYPQPQAYPPQRVPAPPQHDQWNPGPVAGLWANDAPGAGNPGVWDV